VLIWPSDIYLGAQMTILGAELTWICLTPLHFCVCPKPGLFAFLFFCVQWLLFILLILVKKMTINTQCSREAVNTSVIVFGLTRPGLKPMIYHIRGKFLYYLIHVHEYAWNICHWTLSNNQSIIHHYNIIQII
jgi:hypothetical protein